MAIRRKDSFLWGKAPPPVLSPAERRPNETLKVLDDIQKLRLEIDHIRPEIHSSEQTKTVVRNRRFLRGKKKFNMDPKTKCTALRRTSTKSHILFPEVGQKHHFNTGFNYLVENDLLEWRAVSVAEFLYKEEGLNKTAIGNVLGEREEMHLEILKAFVELHEFSDLNLVQALRQFLWSFRLPGEAQKIDRMMEAFATRYCDCNPGVFQSTDTCYILSFAIIMLNTSLHNPSVKEKPSLQLFVSMNKGINNGQDLPSELLAKLYASIRSEPFKIPEDDGNDLTLTFFNPDREGWLVKMGGRVKTWRRRWFILTDSCLYYFKYTTDTDPIGIIPLENLSIRKSQDTSKPYCLELYNTKGQKIKACKTENKGRVVQGKHQSYKLSATSAEERDNWLDAIRASVTKAPFYDLVSSRKRRLINNTSSQD